MIKNTFRTQKKSFAIIVFVLLTCSILLIQGCGSSESAKQNWKVTAVNALGGTPVLATPSCWPDVIFLVTDPAGNAAQGIDVFLYTGADSGIVDGANNCATATNVSMTVPTGNDGTVHVSLNVTPSAVGETFFISASSGPATPALIVSAATRT